jgi:hypothetical protein
MTDLMRLRRATEHENEVEGLARGSGSVCSTSIRVGDCLEVDTVSEDTIPHDRLTRAGIRYPLTGQTRSAQDQRELGLFFFS